MFHQNVKDHERIHIARKLLLRRQNVSKCFLNYLNNKKHRVQIVIRNFESGECPIEKQDGDHRSHKFIVKGTI